VEFGVGQALLSQCLAFYLATFVAIRLFWIFVVGLDRTEQAAGVYFNVTIVLNIFNKYESFVEGTCFTNKMMKI